MVKLVVGDLRQADAPRGAQIDDAHQPGRAARFSQEIGFLSRYGVATDRLLLATMVAKKCGATAEQALLGEGWMRDEDFYRLLARHLKAPFYAGQIAVAENVDAAQAIWDGVAPLARNADGLSHVVAPRGPAIALLLRAAEAGLPSLGVAIASPQRFGACVRTAAARQVAKEGAFSLKNFDAALSAHLRLSFGQRVTAALVALSAIGLWLKNPPFFDICASIGFWLLFGSSIGLRLWAAAAKAPSQRERFIADRDLPIYSIVAPLHREANMIEQLTASLDALDYPRAKLDVKLVVERDDIATLATIARRGLPARYDIIVAPSGLPRTKPRALNVALPSARGRYVVVYDAEDKPDPDQLRRAVSRFTADPALGCLQARLAIEDFDKSWLATMFAVEYAALFGVFNPGLAALGAPIALGGSSNHFRTDCLRRIGGWDAWNVTEDADLGVRLARFGVRVATFDSDTYEEAPPNFSQWLAQRRRWQKGWLQTAIVHTRQPFRIVRELGFLQAWSAMALIGGGIFGAMFGPVFTVAALWRSLFGDLLAPHTAFQWMSSVTALLVLVAGVLAIVAPAIMGLRARRLERLFRALPTLPLYYCLISLAAWLAVFDLVVRPFYWAKTEHGLAEDRR